MASSGGRIFYIIDEGSTASIMLPQKTVLVARDGFNGVVLWKRTIPTWHPHLWPFKSGPTQFQRRLVAVDSRVYVTLGLDAPLTALDAATGRAIRSYEGSWATEEVIASEGVLFLLVNKSPQAYGDFKPEKAHIGLERDRVMRDWAWNEQPRRLLAVQADTGETVWNVERRVAPLTLAADARRVYSHDGEKVVALDRKTGDKVWCSARVKCLRPIPTNITPTLVVYRGVVLFHDAKRMLTALSAATGNIRWSHPHPTSGHFCPQDVLVAGGLVWGGEIARGEDSGEFVGRDPGTGAIQSRFPLDVSVSFVHQRCYRSKATDRYLLPSRAGIEFVDFGSRHWITNHWVRGSCITGIMPSNGLLYAPPHNCSCYMQAKLNGFCALAPESGQPQTPGLLPDKGRCERGPAYGAVPGAATETGEDEDWPTYRHDGARSGVASAAVPAQLKQVWAAPLGGRLSSLVAAGGRLYAASVDAHTIHALDACSGQALWSFTVGGRVDSPPTIFQERVLFGCADGYVYCLRVSDGELVWRFRAAPEDRRMVSFEQVESVWPVHGSVLVREGVVYCVAGRSMFLDGGLHFLRLDAQTGEKLGETLFDDRDPASGKNLQTLASGTTMPVALPDVLSTDGRWLYMRSQQLDFKGRRSLLGRLAASHFDPVEAQRSEGAHLFSPSGFLDDTYWHRTYWVFGRLFAEGAGGWLQAGRVVPSGRILVFDDSLVYGFGRKREYFAWTTPREGHLFAAVRRPQPSSEKPGGKGKKGQAGRSPFQGPEYRWSRSVPLLVRALVLAGDTLFLAGPPDLVDEEEAYSRVTDPEMQAKLAEQDAASAGAKGGLLWAVDAASGEKLADYPLHSLPVFDGLIAAGQRLYLATTAGEVLCFAQR